MDVIGRIVDRLGTVAVAIAALGVLAMVALMGAAVVFRYVIGHPLIWADEAVRYLLVFSVALGLADVMRRGENIRVDLVLDLVRPRTAWAIEIVGLVAALAFGLALVWLGSDMVAFSLDVGLTTAGKIDIPSAWVESALPIGGILLSLAAGVRLLRVLLGKPVDSPGGHERSGSSRE